MGYLRSLLFVGIVSVAACGGGSSSSPTSPGTTNPGTTTTPLGAAAGFKITGISGAVYGTDAQTLTITGTGFGTGMSLSVQSPISIFFPTVFTESQMTGLTATSFQVSHKFPDVGAYTFTLKTATETGTAFPVTPTYRTAGATWIPEGVRMTDVTSGFPGQAFADPAVITLNDGRYRILISAGGDIRSMISSDGLSMTMESGVRIGQQTQIPDSVAIVRLSTVRVIKLDDGRWRLFGGGAPPNSNIYSAVSSDEGLTWTAEAGVRVPLGVASTGMSVVRLRDGRWRGYWTTGTCSTCGSVFSATSTDMVNWTQDAGVRVGSGATITGDAEHPKAIANADGSITLFYWGSRTSQSVNTIVSTSADGLGFTTETPIASVGSCADPDVVRVGSGLRLYCNWGDNTYGRLFSAFSPNGAVAFRAPGIR